MSGLNLFRSEALQAATGLRAGDVLLTRPPAFRFFALCAAFTVIAILMLLSLGTYTRRTTVIGYITYAGGISQVYGLEGGILASKRVKEDQFVRAGEVLFSIQTQRSAQNRNVETTIAEQRQLRLERLLEERARLPDMYREKVTTLSDRKDAIRQTIHELNNQLEAQSQRTELTQRTLTRYKELADRGFFSSEAIQQKAMDDIDQRNRTAELRRLKIDRKRELEDVDAELRALPLQNRNQAAQLDRLISSANQELAEGRSIKEYEVLAPTDGIVTAMSAEIGQTVDPVAALAVVLPVNRQMIAELFAQSKDIGFVRKSDVVALRVESFPYQKFGHISGTVTAVSKSPLTSQQVAQHIKFLPSALSSLDVPLYRITVQLDSAGPGAAEMPGALQPGMKVDADVLQEQRHIYEWILQSLTSGKVALR